MFDELRETGKNEQKAIEGEVVIDNTNTKR